MSFEGKINNFIFPHYTSYTPTPCPTSPYDPAQSSPTGDFAKEEYDVRVAYAHKPNRQPNAVPHLDESQ